MKIRNFSPLLLLLFALGSFSFISTDVKIKYPINSEGNLVSAERQSESIYEPKLVTTVSTNVSPNRTDVYCWGYVVTEGKTNCYISNVVKVKMKSTPYPYPGEKAYPESEVRYDVEKQFKGAVIEEYPNQKNMLGSTSAQFYKTEADAHKYRRQQLTNGCMKGEFRTLSFSYYQD